MDFAQHKSVVIPLRATRRRCRLQVVGRHPVETSARLSYHVGVRLRADEGRRLEAITSRATDFCRDAVREALARAERGAHLDESAASDQEQPESDQAAAEVPAHRAASSR